MSSQLSKTQIDRLGDRLRTGTIDEDDVRLLDLYRLSFSDAYQAVVSRIADATGVQPTGRPAKSTVSITAKLQRESIRLSQIQDIAGCRLVVETLPEQDRVVTVLQGLFENISVVDRRAQPSNGYQAVHLIVSHLDRMIEIQLRTLVQHFWAELSEKLSDVYDPGIKYGAGPIELQAALRNFSAIITAYEVNEMAIRQLELEAPNTPEIKRRLSDLQKSFVDTRKLIVENLRDLINKL